MCAETNENPKEPIEMWRVVTIQGCGVILASGSLLSFTVVARPRSLWVRQSLWSMFLFVGVAAYFAFSGCFPFDDGKAAS